jgi:hypothetical protein
MIKKQTKAIWHCCINFIQKFILNAAFNLLWQYQRTRNISLCNKACSSSVENKEKFSHKCRANFQENTSSKSNYCHLFCFVIHSKPPGGASSLAKTHYLLEKSALIELIAPCRCEHGVPRCQFLFPFLPFAEAHSKCN